MNTEKNTTYDMWIKSFMFYLINENEEEAAAADDDDDDGDEVLN